MQANKVDMWLLTNTKFFAPEKMPFIQEKLASLPEERITLLYTLELRDPTTITLISIFLGEFGVDRFMLKDVGLGIAKLLTLGGCLIWWIIDIFLVGKRAKELNFQRLMYMIS